MDQRAAHSSSSSSSSRTLHAPPLSRSLSHSLSRDVESSSSSKNVVVLGGSYGGLHAATVLAQRLPPSHRVILIERNSHFNHLYVFPRFSTLPGHEHKAFIPYQSIFKDAPKRPTRTSGPAGRSGDSANGAAPAPSAHASTAPTRGSSEQMLGMGSVAGKETTWLRSVASSSSDLSSESRSSFRAGRRPNSSGSRSSSAGDESLFDKESLQSANTTATSLASSYIDHGAAFEKEHLEGKQVAAGTDASNRAVEAGIAAEAQSGITREEEKLGRPEIQVEKLESALQKGIDLEGEAEGTEEGVATGFEDSSPHVVLQATVTSITPTHVIVQSSNTAAAELTGGKKKLWSIDSVSIPYSHMVYALGSHLPDPLRTEARTKKEGVSWMQAIQGRIQSSQEIVLVGGGALGVEFATDIKSVYPDKEVTLIHSRKQLLPNFDEKVHEVALKRLQELGVRTVLGERLALTEGCPRGSSVKGQPQAAVCTPGDAQGEGVRAHQEGICVGGGRKKVKTTGGKEFECDLLLLCTGQQPNSSLMAQLSPTSVDSRTRLVRVLRTLQVQVPSGKDGMAPMPFDPTPPCGDCDCFLDKKAAGGEEEEEEGGEGASQGCLSNIYAIGDVADAFGALNAGYQAWSMADTAVENIVRDIDQVGKGVGGEEERQKKLEQYAPAGNMLKLSLGLGKMVFQGLPLEAGGDGRPVVEEKEDSHDLAVQGVWQFMANMSTDDMYL